MALAVQTGGVVSCVRTVVAQIEALPGLVHGAAQDGESDGEMLLSAEVGP